MLLALIVGGLVGWLASMVMKTDAQMGIVANIAVGVVGSFLGHWLFGVLGFAVYRPLARLIVDVIGAALFIAGLRRLGVYR